MQIEMLASQDNASHALLPISDSLQWRRKHEKVGEAQA